MQAININVITVLLAVFLVSCSTIVRINTDEYLFSYKEPKAPGWSVQKKAYDKIIIINYIKKSFVKKEFSILVEETAPLDVHLDSTIKKAKSRFPPTAQFGESQEWSAAGNNAVRMEFRIPGKKAPIYGLMLLAYKNGYMYNIVFSKYLGKPAKDTEFLELIEAFKID